MAWQRSWNKKSTILALTFQIKFLAVPVPTGESFPKLTSRFRNCSHASSLSLDVSLAALFCFWCLISLSVADITFITQSLLVNQLVIRWKGRLADNATTETAGRPGQSGQSQKDDRAAWSKIPFCKYPVPACCHGNKVHDSNTSSSPSLSLFYPLSPTPPGSPPSTFCQSACRLSLSRSHLSVILPLALLCFSLSLPHLAC